MSFNAIKTSIDAVIAEKSAELIGEEAQPAQTPPLNAAAE